MLSVKYYLLFLLTFVIAQDLLNKSHYTDEKRDVFIRRSVLI